MYNEVSKGKNSTNRFIRMKTIAEGQIFSDFNAYDYIYVDKTDYIFNILRSHRKIFISRPRRFGKSLTLDTIGHRTGCDGKARGPDEQLAIAYAR